MAITISGRLGLTGSVAQYNSGTTNVWVWNITYPTVSQFQFGDSSMLPIIGDWNGDGIEGIGVVSSTLAIPSYYLRQTPTGGAAQLTISYGNASDVPLSWYDQSVNADRIGLYRTSDSKYYLDQGLTGGTAEKIVTSSDITCYAPTLRQCLLKCAAPTCSFTMS